MGAVPAWGVWTTKAKKVKPKIEDETQNTFTRGGAHPPAKSVR